MRRWAFLLAGVLAFAGAAWFVRSSALLGGDPWDPLTLRRWVAHSMIMPASHSQFRRRAKVSINDRPSALRSTKASVPPRRRGLRIRVARVPKPKMALPAPMMTTLGFIFVSSGVTG